MPIKLLGFICIALLIAGCSGSKTVSDKYDDFNIVETEIRELDTLTVTASKSDPVYELPVYRPTATREFDLLHTELDCRFDWSKQHLLGKATLVLSPYFHPENRLVLDAKGFDIHAIKIKSGNDWKPLEYEYNGAKLNIDLGQIYTREDEITVFIDYTAKPNDLEVGGSAAITADKGLYFINPLGEEQGKPMQIWTQGETESSSCWFPTIDKPNERCTQKIHLTVEDKYETLSNGVLTSSKKNADGTRTDSYEMELSHAPYLFMMAIGEFAVVTEKWGDVLVEYYVEKEYEDAAKGIFSNTPEMLSFFSDLWGVKYPWPKYSQVVVRDYVSGAMENTTGVIYGEFVQKTNRELIDNHNERIVAHELSHHWFGDLVTCESWSNLALNESFANYSEYLWFEHKYGRDAAEFHRMGEIAGYLSQARGNIHDLIWFDYDDKEDTFDAHSYNKGGAILHMLRTYLGDDAFFAGLNKYLVDNEYSDVEAHELRLAMEDISGEDLNWFFNQWFFEAGHPQIEVETDIKYQGYTKLVEIVVTQKQDAERSIPIFQLPVKVQIHSDDMVYTHPVMINERKQTMTFEVGRNFEPTWITIDADRALLAEIEYLDKPTEAYLTQFNKSDQLLDRYEAIDYLGEKGFKDEKIQLALTAGLEDPYWAIRRAAIRSSEDIDGEVLKKMAVGDPRSHVRAAALEKIGLTGDLSYASIVKKAIEDDQAYRCVAAGLQALHDLKSPDAFTYAKKMENEDNWSVIATIGNIYAGTGSAEYLPFFENNWHKIGGFSSMNFFSNYMELVKACDEQQIDQSMKKLMGVATNMSHTPFRRYSAAKSISDMKKEYQKQIKGSEEGDQKAALEAKVEKLNEMIASIIEAESSDQLKQFYSSF